MILSKIISLNQMSLNRTEEEKRYFFVLNNVVKLLKIYNIEIPHEICCSDFFEEKSFEHNNFSRIIFCDDDDMFWRRLMKQRAIEFFTFDKIAEIKSLLNLDVSSETYSITKIVIGYHVNLCGQENGCILKFSFMNSDKNNKLKYDIDSSDIVAKLYIDFFEYLVKCVDSLFSMKFDPKSFD